MKKIWMVLSVVMSLTAFGYETWTDPETEIEWKYTLSGNVAVLGVGDKSETAISTNWTGYLTLPSKIGDYPVKSISKYAFWKCKKIIGVTIPEGVTNVDSSAFLNCSQLDSVKMPQSIKTVRSYAFDNCPIRNVELPGWKCGLSFGTVTNLVISEGTKSIKDKEFNSCSALKRVWLPLSITNGVYNTTFSECEKLNKILVDENHPTFSSKNGFLLNKAGTDIVCPVSGDAIIPEGVTNINEFAFSSMMGLTSVIIPSTVEIIGRFAFRNCSNLKTVIIREGVKKIYAKAFENCTNLTTISIPKSIISIVSSAFDYCQKIKNAEVPGWQCNLYFNPITNLTITAGTTNLAANAFQDGVSLVNVSIPTSVVNIDEEAFAKCASLVRISVAEDNPSYISKDGWLLSKDGQHLIRGTKAIMPIPTGITSIDNNAFCGYTDIKDMVIPEGVVSIGSKAFLGCTSLANITIPASVTNIGEAAFACGKNLKTITIDSENKFYEAIDGMLLSKDKGLLIWAMDCKEVIIPNGVKKIGGYAFYNCSSITNIVIPVGVTNVGEFAFSKCSALKNMDLPVGLTYLGNSAFSSCTSLLSVVIPEGITSIGEFTFSLCSSLKSIIIPSSVKSVGNYAFSSCSKLSSATILRGVESLGEQVFGYCSALSSIKIPITLTKFGFEVFWKVENLRNVELPGSRCGLNLSGITDLAISEGTTNISWYAFSSLKTIKRITIPACVVDINSNAFANCSGVTNVVFGGNAPKVPIDANPFTGVNSNCTAMVYANTKGWDEDGDGKWMGLTLIYKERPNEPIPDLGDNPTESQIAEALEESVDEKLQNSITNAATYNAFREWAENVKGVGEEKAGTSAVLASPNAFLAFALDSDKLITEAPTNGTMTVEEFVPTTEAGQFEFTVSVDNIQVGSKASEDNLKRIFGIEGGASLGDMNADNVKLNFSTPSNGKVKFTAGPNDATQEVFFMKVKMNP